MSIGKSTAWVASLLVAIGLAVGGWFVGQGIEGFRKADRFITIKGLAEHDVKSDYAIWVITFRRAGSDYGMLQKELTADRDKVIAFLKTQGFDGSSVEPRSLNITDLLAREYGQQDNLAFRYTGQGAVVIKTDQVDAVAAAVNHQDALIQEGVQISSDGQYSGQPRYYLRGFNEIKPQLLAQAIGNAREQAERFAKDAGARLGQLRQANQGNIQILDDDGGDQYSSGTTIGKRLRVVSSFIFSLD
ncbi:SIMPL domain-containing protein [Orrella sp. 11846]|uniref:SIMPL domain-containing protein n=1 Tax=Orrella sp. 11846 TaxID=3409913 RepID=UPI003B58D987